MSTIKMCVQTLQNTVTHRYDGSGALKRLDVEIDFEQAAKEYGAVEHYHSDGAEFDFGQYSTAGLRTERSRSDWRWAFFITALTSSLRESPRPRALRELRALVIRAGAQHLRRST